MAASPNQADQPADGESDQDTESVAVQRDAEDETDREADADAFGFVQGVSPIRCAGPAVRAGTADEARHSPNSTIAAVKECDMIRKLSSGKYRLYSRKVNPKTGKRRNLGTFGSRAAAEKHERAVQYFKRH